jgi:hypothetical protein
LVTGPVFEEQELLATVGPVTLQVGLPDGGSEPVVPVIVAV